MFFHQSKLLCLLLGLGIYVTATAEATRAETVPMSIGAIAELSGPFATIGEECRRGYTIAEKVYFTPALTKRAKIIYGDHQRDPKIGVAEFNRLMREPNLIAVASNAAPVGQALNPLSEAAKIPLLASSAHPALMENPYAFRYWLNGKVEGSALAQKAWDLSKRRAAILTIEDDYPLAVTDGFKKKFVDLGGTVTVAETVLKTEVDFSTIIRKLAATKPDVIFLNILGDQLAIAIRRTREQNLQQQLLGTFSMGKKEIIERAGSAADGIIYLELDGQRAEFITKLKELFDTDKSTGLNYACFLSLGTILKLLDSHPEINSAASFMELLKNTSRIELLGESIEMKNREAMIGYRYRTIQNGTIADLN